MVAKVNYTATTTRDRTLPTRTILAAHLTPDLALPEVPIVTNLQETASDKASRSPISSKCDKMRTQITNPHSPSMKKNRAHNPQQTRCENRLIQGRLREIKLDNQISLRHHTMLQRRICKWKKKVAKHHQ